MIFPITDPSWNVDIHARRSKHVRRANQVKSKDSSQKTSQVSQVKEVDTQEHLVHQKLLPPSNFDNKKQVLHQTTFTQNTFCTKHRLHQANLHQAPSTQNTFYTKITKQLLDKTPFTPSTFYTKQIYTKQLLHKTPFTPETFYTKQLLHQANRHQTLFTPETFCTKQLLHQTNLHQAPFTQNPRAAYNRYIYIYIDSAPRAAYIYILFRYDMYVYLQYICIQFDAA